ncbi:hypothetical protein MVEN_01806500 [Mycena venus]|uniref:Uncharacterized protein n=1 Tax=Mycena venus TaxID=2733690 RepID=A0A8H6XKL1_9AGAR|nr:hypothetical protein MVEN_01806500 [Mycena venus]
MPHCTKTVSQLNRDELHELLSAAATFDLDRAGNVTALRARVKTYIDANDYYIGHVRNVLTFQERKVQSLWSNWLPALPFYSDHLNDFLLPELLVPAQPGGCARSPSTCSTASCRPSNTPSAANSPSKQRPTTTSSRAAANLAFDKVVSSNIGNPQQKGFDQPQIQPG